MKEGRHLELRSIAIGIVALLGFLASVVGLVALHLQNITILGVLLPGELLLALVIVLAIVVGRLTDSRIWFYGLLAGVGMGVPGFFVALYMESPDWRTWLYNLGLPSRERWMLLASILLITSLGAQSTALWHRRRRALALFMQLATVGLVVAVWIGGIRATQYLSKRDQALQAVKTRPGFDIPLPELALTRLDGTPILAAEFTGHITVLDFWGTWCAACISEFPSLEAVYKDYPASTKVRFLMVNPELAGDTSEKIKLFLGRKPISLPIALDPGTPYFELASKLHNEALPMLIIVDQQGHIKFYETESEGSDKNRQSLRANIDALVAKM